MSQDQRETTFCGIDPGEGLAWTWHLDFDALLAALSEPAPWNRSRPPTTRPSGPLANSGPAGLSGAELSGGGLPGGGLPGGELPGGEPSSAESFASAVDPVEAEFAEYLEAVDAGRTSVVPLSAAAGRVAEILPASPDLAAWLACNPADSLENGALAGAAAAYRRLAAWAQAGELAVVAQMASRSAAADKPDGIDDNGRPGKIPADAYGQVSLALTLSQSGAEWWTNLAVSLQWRLAATGIALRDGTIDLTRAKAIVEATAALDDDKARAVEAKILPRAGEQTTGQLRASLRRAVITADPEGAERRREEAERRAKVILYPDAEGTASLNGQNLPGIRAAAALARITALARALKAAGVEGGIDLLRSKVFLGLLLGTLPHIPPPPDGPPDSDEPPGTGPAAGDDAGNPLIDDWPWNDDPAQGDHKERSEPCASNQDSRPEDGPGDDSSQKDSPAEGDPAAGEGPAVGDALPAGDAASAGGDRVVGGGLSAGVDRGVGGGFSAGVDRGVGDALPVGDAASAGGDRVVGGGLSAGDAMSAGGDSSAAGGPAVGAGPEVGRVPAADEDRPGTEDLPEDDDRQPGGDWTDDDDLGLGDHGPGAEEDEDQACLSTGDDPMPWPDATPFLLPGPAALKNLQPVGRPSLDLRLSWTTLLRRGPEPGYLTRFGPITPAQASCLALLAAADPVVEWRVVLADPNGRAQAVARVRPKRSPAGLSRAGPAGPPDSGGSLLRRVTVVMNADELSILSTEGRGAGAGGAVGRGAGVSGAEAGGAESCGAWVSGAEAGGAESCGAWAGGAEGCCVEGCGAGGGCAEGRCAEGRCGEGRCAGGGCDARADDGYRAVIAAVIVAARRAALRAAERAAVDAAAGGCGHAQASLAYQVPARLRDFVNLRDLTCRFPTCRQPAWRCDADHTKPYDQGGPTCSCNLGPLCRYHHALKQHPQWRLDQPVPGVFVWTTPVGRTYLVEPDRQAA